MQSKIVIDNKTVVTFDGSLINDNFARAWLKKKGLSPKTFFIVSDIRETPERKSKLLYTTIKVYDMI